MYNLFYKPNETNNQYLFDTVNEKVQITPMSHLFCDRIMRKFNSVMRDVIQPNQCFMNAAIAADFFANEGFYVEVVEGYTLLNDYASKFAEKYGVSLYKENSHSELIEHRWCKKGDKYFDVTIEFLFGWEMVKIMDYTAQRVYDYEDLIDFAALIGKEYYGDKKLKFVDSIKGVSYLYDGDKDIPIYWGYINDEGKFVEAMGNSTQRNRINKKEA